MGGQIMAAIREKIEKLLALATSPNENEAKAALLKAKELMAEHKLTEADFEDLKKQELKALKCEDVTWTTDSGRIWMAGLCKLVCDEYLCVSAWITKPGTRTHTLVITGMEGDLEVCKSVVEYAVGFVEGQIKILQRRYHTQDSKAIANSYADGFILGLEMAFEEQREDHPEWGLVVVKSEEVNRFEENLGSKSVRTKKSNFDPLAYMRGQTDGQNFNKQKVLAG
jgi:hypothetical protein